MNKRRDISAEERNLIIPRDRNLTFERDTDFTVPYTRANLNRCKCPQCPVQADSQCAQDEIRSSKKAMENMPAGEVPSPGDFPGVYCSIGEAGCKDLDFDGQCICGSCEVWKEYDLKDANPNNHFCQQGKAT